MDRAQKAEQIGLLNEAFGKAGVVVVARYQGMTVADMSKLRTQMRAVGASFKVSKNRLAKRANRKSRAWLRHIINPPFERMMIGKNQVGHHRRFVEERGEAGNERHAGDCSLQFVPFGKREERI